MNEVLKAMRDRRSIRSFKEDQVADDLIEQVVDAGLWAASGRGAQAPIMVVVKDRALRDRIAEANRAIGGWKEGFDPFYGAPVIICVLASKEVPTYVCDGSLALGNMMLAAHALGLGGIWIHRCREEFETDEFKALLSDLGVEGDYEGVGHLALGYAEKDGVAAPRREGRVFWVR